MDIYVTDLETNDKLRFPMIPEQISIQTGVIFQNYTVLSIGDIKLPNGEELTGFQWDGILPGEARKVMFSRVTAPINNEEDSKLFIPVSEWKTPREIQSMWSVWRAKKKKLRLLITETPVNHDVYLERYSADYKGGYGDYYYKISFIQAKDLKVYVSGASGSGSTANTSANKPLGDERPTPPAAGNYTVVKGDSLWKIAQKLLGDGSRYTELFEANKDIIGSNPSLIMPGQILTIS